MAIENLREIGNVLYEQRADGMLYPVRRIRPDMEAQGVKPQTPGILDVGGLREKLTLLNQTFNPVEAIGQSMRAGERMMSPDVPGWDRVAAMGDMLSGVAGVAAPAAALARTGAPAATALMEGLLGWSPTREAVGDTARAVGRDVVDRLNQRGPMPTTYSNPIPGLLGGADEAGSLPGMGRGRPSLDVSRHDASNIFGAGSERVRYTDPQSGGTIEVVVRPDGSASVLELEVPEASRGQGIGQTMQERVMQDFPIMGGQVSSKAAATTAYRLGRRPPGKPDATLEEVFADIDEMSSVNMVSPAMQERLAPAVPSPRNPIPGLLGGADEAAPQVKIKGWHGTPHEFPPAIRVLDRETGKTYVQAADDPVARGFLSQQPDRYAIVDENPLGMFDFSKMGTGEGAQAYGWGGYLSEAPDVSRSYRDMAGSDMTVGGKPISEIYEKISSRADRLPAKAAEAEYSKMALLDDLMNDGDIFGVMERAKNDAYDAATLSWFEKEISPKFKRQGSLYEVNVNANPDDFLDWDRPLSEQPNVLKKLGFFNMDEDAMHAEAARIMDALPGGAWMDDPVSKARIDELQNMIDRPAPKMTGQEYYFGGVDGDVANILSQMGRGNPEAKSKELLDAGIPGIRYLDAGSRGAGEGSRNYVVFDENLINIVRKYGIAGAAIMLGMSEADVAQAMQQQQPQGLLSTGAQ